MNQKQRKQILNIRERLSSIYDEIDELKEEENEKFENASEGLQATEKFQKIDENAEILGEVTCLVEEAFMALDELLEN